MQPPAEPSARVIAVYSMVVWKFTILPKCSFGGYWLCEIPLKLNLVDTWDYFWRPRAYLTVHSLLIITEITVSNLNVSWIETGFEARPQSSFY